MAPRPARADSGAGPPSASSPDLDPVLDGFVAAFGLPYQQLRLVLERQPALRRASPQLLADRIAAFTRATGLPAYQLLYMVARRPAVLKLAPSALRGLCEDLARSLSLSPEDGLRLAVRQPALLEMRPSAVHALSRRVAEELRVVPAVSIRVVTGLPPEQLGAVVRLPPGALRERVKALRLLLKRTFGRDRAMPTGVVRLVVRCPPLLVLPTKAVAATLEALMSIPPTKGKLGPARGGSGSTGGGGGGRSLLDAVMACPHILSLPAETLRARFVAIAATTLIDTPAVVSMLLLEPRLLLLEPARMRARLEALTFSLMLPRRAALDMVVRQPQLLVYQTETLADSWAALQEQLGVSYETVAAMVTRHPSLLCLPASLLASKLATLEAVFCLPRPRAVMLAVQWPKLLTVSETRLQRKHRLLSLLVSGLDPAALGRLVFRQPYLLVEDGARLVAKVREAAAVLGVPDLVVGDMLGRAPNFITSDPSCWRANLETLTGRMGLSREQAAAAAYYLPRLLAAEPDVLSSSAASTMSLLRSSPVWMERLARGEPPVVGQCAQGYPPWVRERLQFIVDSNLQARQSFTSPILWDGPAFLQRYPEFPAWQRRRAAEATAPNGMPLPRLEGAQLDAGSRGTQDEANSATLAADTAAPPGEAEAVTYAPAADVRQSGSAGPGVESAAEPQVGQLEGAEVGRTDAQQLPSVVGAASVMQDAPDGEDGGARGRAAKRGRGGGGAKTGRRTVPRRQRVRVLASVSSTDEQD